MSGPGFEPAVAWGSQPAVQIEGNFNYVSVRSFILSGAPRLATTPAGDLCNDVAFASREIGVLRSAALNMAITNRKRIVDGSANPVELFARDDQGRHDPHAKLVRRHIDIALAEQVLGDVPHDGA